MLTYVATLFLSLLVYGPWKDPEGFGFPQTRMFSPARRPLPIAAGRARALHLGVVVALLVGARRPGCC